MAFKNIKGLTVEIGGDTTELGKALESVNKKSSTLSSELSEVNKLLKFNPGDTELLAQKQKILADTVENTSKRLDTLREAEKQVQAQFKRGEVSEEQVRALQREIIETSSKMEHYSNVARDTAEEIEQLGNTSRAAKNASEGLGDSLNNIANRGLATVGALAGSAVTALTAAAETTRDYRLEMGKLDTAFTDNGFSSEAATTAYQELVGVLGEYDQSVEAANHLAKLTDNEKDLAKWTGDILPGVFATFGDSLPIEGLTEAANESSRVGAVVGPLADAINWAADKNTDWTAVLGSNSKALEAFESATAEGMSAEDAYSAALAACTTEQERQALITATLSGLYGDASSAYKETNADIIAANKANDAWTASLAEVGAAVEPVLTDVKNFGAELLSNIVPAIEKILDNLPTVAVALAGITAALVSYKVAALAATAAENGMTLAKYAATAAQTALNAAMSANPIGLIILAITALAAAFTYLWQNSESFRNFWIGLWENIKSAVSTAIEFLGTLPEIIGTWLTNVINIVTTWGASVIAKAMEVGGNFLNTITTFFTQLPGQISTWLTATINNITQWVSETIAKAQEMGSNFLANVVTFFQELPYNLGYWLGTALGTIAKWAIDTWNKAKEMGKNFLTAVVSFFKQLPGQVASWINNTLTKISTWAVNTTNKAKEMGRNFLNSVISFFKELPGKVGSWLTNTINKVSTWASNMASKAKTTGTNFINNVVNFFKQLPGKIGTVLTNIISKVTSWASNLITKGKNAAKGLADAVVNGIKSLPGKMLSIGSDIVSGVWNGISNSIGWIKDKVASFASGILDGIKGALGINSPSKEGIWIGDMLDRGIAKGVEDNADRPFKAAAKMSHGLVDAAANGVDGFALDSQLRRPAAANVAAGPADSGLGTKLDKILAAIERGQILTIDGDALVGATVNKIDSSLGQRRALAARGAV